MGIYFISGTALLKCHIIYTLQTALWEVSAQRWRTQRPRLCVQFHMREICELNVDVVICVRCRRRVVVVDVVLVSGTARRARNNRENDDTTRRQWKCLSWRNSLTQSGLVRPTPTPVRKVCTEHCAKIAQNTRVVALFSVTQFASVLWTENSISLWTQRRGGGAKYIRANSDESLFLHAHALHARA